MTLMTYMVVEHFRKGDAVPVYQRFRERGRMAPQGLEHVASWVTPDLTRCYQIMKTRDRVLLEEWMDSWSDLVEFEVHPVITTEEAAERIAPRLRG